MRNITRRLTVRLPVVRVRSMFTGLCALILGIAGPLVLVWKQSYINQASIKLENRADTLATLNSDITSLSLERGKLLSQSRVERIARTQGLEYPTSGQLEVLEVKMPEQKIKNGIGGFFTRVKRSLLEKIDGGPV